ncbi:MAG: ribosome small subunit-dependent GTPase A [Bacteroidales bacterium]|nr:ribosome small subunit-dependent GTPase A [Bacteroidales bacterium]
MYQGRVIKSTGSWYSVETDGKIINCKLRGKFRTEALRHTNPVAVGDWVICSIDGENGIIESVKKRKNFLIRKATNLSRKTHIIAANIDQALLVVTPRSPQTTTVFIDRFLVSAEAYNIPVILIFNKTDLYSEEDLDVVAYWMATYHEIGYKVLNTSAAKNQNITKFQDILKDKVSVISGHSGVGKSSLINKVDESLRLKTAEISFAHNTGKHTTSYAQMLKLSFGGYIVDTPGIRAFGLIDLNLNEIWHYFPEMFEIGKNCQYYNCTHVHEPGCKVIEAVETGEIALSRYESYLNIIEADDNKFRKDKYV